MGIARREYCGNVEAALAEIVYPARDSISAAIARTIGSSSTMRIRSPAPGTIDGCAGMRGARARLKGLDRP